MDTFPFHEAWTKDCGLIVEKTLYLNYNKSMSAWLYLTKEFYIHGWETAGCSRHAGQSNFPRTVCRPIGLAWKKLHGFVTKKAQETCFVSPRRKAISPMDSPLSQHKKRSLPSDIRYFPFALVNYSVTPTLTYFRPRWNSAANQRAQHCAGKSRRQSVNEYGGWRHTMARSYGIAVGLLVWKLLFLSLR